MHLFPDDVAQGFLDDGWWSGRTWSDHLEANRAASPDKTALIDAANRSSYMVGEPRRLTWAQVADEVDRLARRLFAHGVRADTVVGVQLPNCVELPLVFLAVARLGAIVSPFPVQYRRHELGDMGTRAGITTFVTVTSGVGRDLAAEAVALRDVVGGLETILAFGPDTPPGCASLEPLDEPTTTSTVDADYASHVAGRAPGSNDCVTLVWTSGTEGVPKGVPRAYGDWEVVGDACAQSPGLRADDVLLNPFPMVNGGGMAGMFVPWLALGATLVQHQPFDLGVFIDQIEAERVTYTCAPPAVLDALVADDVTFERHDLSSLRAVSSGSAPLSGWMIRRWEADHGVEVLNLFGSNEGGLLFADPDTVPDPAERGQLFPRYDVPDMPYRTAVARAMSGRLVDLDDGSEITEPGRAGELRLKGPAIFAGYWGQGRHGFDDDGWFCTGDVFEISDRHPSYLKHVDRAKDLIIRGGYKISAAEIEGLLLANDRVAEVAAVAMPDPRLGERLCVFVVPRGPAQPSLEDLVATLRAADVATFKLPERLVVVEALPRNPVGKVLKRELREQLRLEDVSA